MSDIQKKKFYLTVCIFTFPDCYEVTELKQNSSFKMPIFQKLFGNADDKGKPAVTPPGLQTMGAPLQRKFAKGVQYNSMFHFSIPVYKIKL